MKAHPVNSWSARIAGVFFLLHLACLPAIAQTPQDLRDMVRRAAAVFADGTRDAAARLSAVEPYPTIYDPEQIAAFKAIARSPSEPPAIRAAALTRIEPYFANDPALFEDLLAWLESADTPLELRTASLGLARSLSLSLQNLRERILATMRVLTKDRDVSFREAAFALLCSAGDGYAQGLLIDGLNDPGGALLPPEKAVALLGLRLHGDFYPTLHKVMLDPPSDATRLECIRLLGGYGPAREKLVEYLQSPRESKAARLAAIGALHANAPDELARLALPVVADERAPDEVRVYAIQAELNRQRGRAARSELDADAFDRKIQELARTSASESVRQAAQRYVERAGPKQ